MRCPTTTSGAGGALIRGGQDCSRLKEHDASHPREEERGENLVSWPMTTPAASSVTGTALAQQLVVVLLGLYDVLTHFQTIESGEWWGQTTIILVAVIYYYSRPLSTITCIRALLYSAIAPTIFAGQIDPFLFEALYASQHAIFLFARIPQIWQNFSNKSTGELSFLTSFMNFAGSMVRVFTTIQENAPNSVLLGYAIGVATNFTILSQIILYQKPQVQKEKKTK